MEEIERALGRARAWSTELEQVVNARANLTRAALVAVIFAAGVIVLVVGFVSEAMPTGSVVRSSAPLLIWFPLLFVGFIIVARRRALASPWWIIMAGALVVFASFPVWLNGSLAVVMTTSLMAVFHLILSPPVALGFSLAAVGGQVAGLVFTSAAVDPQVAVRGLGSALITIVVMQVVMRHVARVNAAAAQLSGEVGSEVQRLSAELLAAQRESERLAAIDASTGVRSEAAIAKVLEEAAPPAELVAPAVAPLAAVAGMDPSAAAPRVPVVALRFTRWDEALLALDGRQRLLLQAALGARLREVFGPLALIGRRSAADFLALIPAVDADLANVTALRGLQERLERPLRIEGQEVVLAPALGVAVWPEDAPALRAAVADAEVARAVAARAVTREPLRYSPRLRQHLATRAELASQILGGISAGEFILHYQPIVSLERRRVLRAEALLRWQHPILGLLSPSQFLDVAEERGLLRALTNWIGAQVAADLGPLRDTIDPAFRVAINVPPEVLVWWAEDPMGLIAKAQGLGLAGDGLVLEVTENAFLNPSAGVIRILEAARTAGALVAIDDFGTGYSSLGRLLDLPVDIIKLDRVLATGLDADPKQQAIVRALVGLARDVGLQVVAEGVERSEESRTLVDLGCTDVQGFVHAAAVPAAELPQVIRRIEARLSS